MFVLSSGRSTGRELVVGRAHCLALIVRLRETGLTPGRVANQSERDKRLPCRIHLEFCFQARYWCCPGSQSCLACFHLVNRNNGFNQQPVFERVSGCLSIELFQIEGGQSIFATVEIKNVAWQ